MLVFRLTSFDAITSHDLISENSSIYNVPRGAINAKWQHFGFCPVNQIDVPVFPLDSMFKIENQSFLKAFDIQA
jgi:hypothetical protein